MNNFRLDFAVLMLLVSCGFGFSQTASPKPTNVAQTISLDELKIADSLIEKADAAYYAKKFDEAALLYAQAASMPPVAYTKDSIYYNAACSAALAAKPDDAFGYLEKAVEGGYRKPDSLASDPDLSALRTDKRWEKIIAKARQNEISYRKKHSDPLKARFITSDIDNFIRAFDLAAKEATDEGKIKIFKTEYLERGTPGLIDFYRNKKIGGINSIVSMVKAYPLYFNSLRTLPQRLETYQDGMRKGFVRLKEMYPEAFYPDVYFVVGHNRSSGTISDRGLLLAGESINVSPGTPLDEIPDKFRKYFHPITDVPQYVAHELVHFQQKLDGKRTLLDWAIIEGGADFIADLLVPGLPTPDYRAWGEAHERLVWERFQKEMNSTDTSNWIANNDKATPEWEAVQGYYIGYKITKAYYEQAKDKKAALRNLIHIADPQAILRESKYGEKFADWLYRF